MTRCRVLSLLTLIGACSADSGPSMPEKPQERAETPAPGPVAPPPLAPKSVVLRYLRLPSLKELPGGHVVRSLEEFRRLLLRGNEGQGAVLHEERNPVAYDREMVLVYAASLPDTSYGVRMEVEKTGKEILVRMIRFKKETVAMMMVVHVALAAVVEKSSLPVRFDGPRD